ncbi:MAG: polysaccharide biosynthesis tyrosine autokinase, partial [Cyclobacteriaceae bacterium]
MEQLSNINSQQDNFQLKRFANLIIGRWYWVLGFLGGSLLMAFLIIRYASPVYVVSTSFLTKKYDDRLAANPLMSLAESSGSPIYRSGLVEMSQEIPLLKSQDRIRTTLDQLSFGTSYHIEGKFKTSEVYPSDFYEVSLSSGSQRAPYGNPIYLSVVETGYQLSTPDEEWNELLKDQIFEFGEEYTIAGWAFTITSKNRNGMPENQHYFVLRNPTDLLNSYRNRLNLNWQKQGSSILNASITSEIPEKDHAFMHTYLDVIVEKGLKEKSEGISNTISFINEYLPQISDSMLVYQKRLDQFKLENGAGIDGSAVVFDRLSELEVEKAELMIANRYLDYLVKYIKENRDAEVFAPAMIGLDKPPLQSLLNQYIEIRWTEQEDMNASNSKNPLVQRKNGDLDRIEQNIFEGIRSLKQVNYNEIAGVDRKIDFYYSTIGDIQDASREYAELTRMISLYESVFNDLITRRTEAFLSQASITSDYQVVSDPTYDKTTPISPDKNKIFIIAIFIGLGVPLGVLYVFSISNNKVVSKHDLLMNTNIPLLGYVGHSIEKNSLVVFQKPKSLVAESFRRIRANLQYFSKGNGKNVLLLTSSISAEGKTFCSLNLAFTYASSGKKTIIVGADMRKPTLGKIMGMHRDQGLSNYLSGQCTLDEAIHETGNKDLQIIPGGSIPPNPAELILLPRMRDMMDHLKANYELVIIDTPPIGLVADAIELMEFSDLNILIVRQNVTFKKSLHETTEQYEKGQLKNMAILFNDVDFQKLEYGYKAYVEGYQSYGYGYNSGYFEEQTRKSVLQKIVGSK